MTKITSRFGLAVGMALIAGTVVLVACGGPAPVTRTTTVDQTTTSVPRPTDSSTTTTTQQTQVP
jgi:hypothetical protein